MELVPCRDCARHARTTEARCPFCGGRLGSSPRRPRIVATVTRAMIFYAGAMTACAAEAPPPEPSAEVSVGAPMHPSAPAGEPPEPREPAAVAIGAVEVDEDDAERRRERRHAEARKHPPRVQHVRRHPPPPCCPPYGAPAADFTIV